MPTEAELLKVYCYGNPNAVDISDDDWVAWRYYVDTILRANLEPPFETIHEWRDINNNFAQGETFDEHCSLYAIVYTPPGVQITKEMKEAVVIAPVEKLQIENNMEHLPAAKLLYKKYLQVQQIKKAMHDLIDTIFATY